MKEFVTKPKMGVFLGTVDYNGDWELYNVNGKAVAMKYNDHVKKWLVTSNHIGMGYMLRKLGIEASAGGQIFKHYSIKKSFKGLNREQIIELQKESGA